MWLFLPYVDMNQPWMYVCSPSWTPLPPPSPSHPSRSSQCTSPEHPVSCIRPGLAIYFTYDNIHVSVLSLISFPHLALSHRVQKIVLYICVSFAVSHTVLSLLILKKINLSEEKFAKLECWGRFYSRLLQESSEITIDFGRQRTQSKHSYVQYLMIWNHGENAIPKWSQRRTNPALFCLYEI